MEGGGAEEAAGVIQRVAQQSMETEPQAQSPETGIDTRQPQGQSRLLPPESPQPTDRHVFPPEPCWSEHTAEHLFANSPDGAVLTPNAHPHARTSPPNSPGRGPDGGPTTPPPPPPPLPPLRTQDKS
ncbi:hypothetical protein EYF80_030168 [Liparis tanakae]|uniref:Uncharacterized protein n=1 Tax=Liparis tanakae TaxID=230148 RepID=A0A4Z2H1F5_9TELE|nr:hypothetical protein EYF80_030168 [Liparis tanakae]